MKYLLRVLASGFAIMGLGISTAYPAAQARATPVVTGFNEFAFDLYKQVDQTEENAILSPYSLSSLLGILANGAASTTHAEIMTVLHLEENQNMRALTKELTNLELALKTRACNSWLRCTFNKLFLSNSRNSELIAANALWADGGFTYKDSFLTLMGQNKAANFERVNFTQAPEKARKKINRWVKKNTQDYIEELLPPGSVTSDTRLILTNALYFKGKWGAPFKSEETQTKPFTLTNGKTVAVPMMQQQGKFFYAENEQLQMLQMPYAKSSLAMMVLLPKANHTLQELQQMLNNTLFLQLLQESYKQVVMVNLPRFTAESTFAGLAKSLQTLGMNEAFNEKANFSNMTTDPLMISDVIQKAVIEVNEEGTVAAAATAMLMETTAYLPVTFEANHPFFFIIYDTQSKVILFLGQVLSPV